MYCRQFGVPVALVTGCQVTAEEAREFLPHVETAIVKQSINRQTARNLSPDKARALIREKTISALSRIKEMQPKVLIGPYTVEVAYLHSGLADAAGILPLVERIDSTTHRFETEDYISAFRYIRSLIAIAGSLS